MEIPDGNFRHILLYYFRKGKNAVQARYLDSSQIERNSTH